MLIPKKAIFLRHANAEPFEDPSADHVRMLTEKGRTQADAMAIKLSHLPIMGNMVSSTAERAKATADIVGAGRAMHGMKVLYCAQTPEERKISETAFKELAYAPLTKYMARDDAGWLLRYGLQMVVAISYIYEDILDGTDDDPNSYLMIAGHAVTQPLAALLMYPQHGREILEINMGEADALVITADSFEHVKAE